MENEKQNCDCNDLHYFKKGYSGKSAFWTVFGLSAFWIIVVLVQLNDSYSFAPSQISPLVTWIAACSAPLGLLAGTVGMNDIYGLCKKCAKVKFIKSGGEIY